ncbi:HET-domain-containing protein, partial [Rhizodiscina lignyota]
MTREWDAIGTLKRPARNEFALSFTFEVPKTSKTVISPYFVLPIALHRTSVSKRYRLEARRVLSTNFNGELIRSWLAICDSSHVDCTSRPRWEKKFVGFRVIDVEKHCIVRMPRECRYTALSYVWGKVDQLKLSLAKIFDWKDPGSLLDVQLPATIRDAISVCQLLGLRYLWVDSLCIVQDSPAEVTSQTQNMDAIYRMAYLTIIVAAGDDSNHGIPSIQSREAVQYIGQAQGVQIGTTLALGRNEILSSTWNSRAWTLQEYALSHRRLIFTSRQIFYSC